MRSTALATEFQIACNFVCAIIDLPTGSVAALLNNYFPLIAFTEPFEERQLPLRFVGIPELASGFAESGVYQVLMTTELQLRASEESIANLSTPELKEIKFWKPKTVGEIIFNFWD